ncbi:hypothetical protein M422DRAFT_262737 [Sphaerobolus stellatus SS14]|uniref:Chromo domain-containing protein n=1 Tax=Sphaerobolus stellatus (strain SS14) TaxID=990650 RepID=A0A0C9V090_SPHS4|nr:hypothetical protein M422DRAFT_262737 [Sphaerobolus stellatus SS14]
MDKPNGLIKHWNKFAYNNAPSETTSFSPFFANKGYHPNITVYPEWDLASAWAHEFTTDLDELHQHLKSNMLEAQKRYQGPADHRCAALPPFKIGDKKLAEKYLGPYEIIAQPGTLSYTLCLPDNFRAVHPVFHISMLEPATPNPFPDQTIPPPLAIVIDEEEDNYEIDEILDSKVDRRRKCKLQYLVKWMGYEGTGQDSNWVLATEVNTSELIEDFHRLYPTKPGPLSAL